MRHDFLDRYSRLQSPIHHVRPGVKVFLSLSAVLAAVLVPISVVPFFTAMGVALVAAAIVSGIPASFLVKRLLFLEPVVLGVALLSLAQPGGGMIFLSLVTKSTLCLFTMILLSNTTPFADILRVLRWMKAPSLLVTILALMYRYLFVLIDELERMQRARASRTIVGGRLRAWKSLTTVVGQLFVRSSERAERIYAAMSARGWK